jgi:DNA replication protein DnaC
MGDSNTMTRLSDYLPSFCDKLDAMRADAAQRKAERIAAHGWPATARCAECGDTGRVPERGATCHCAVGDAISGDRKREQAWEDLMPRRFAGYRLETSPQQEAAAQVREWLNQEPAPWRRGENLLLAGPTGTGKTGLAIGALRAMHDQGVSVGLINLPDWLQAQRPGNTSSDDDPLEYAVRPSLLVLDDLGSEKSSEWVQERLYVLINRRYEELKATIVTTNHDDPRILRAGLGVRATSRLFEAITVIGVLGADQRLQLRTDGVA